MDGNGLSASDVALLNGGENGWGGMIWLFAILALMGTYDLCMLTNHAHTWYRCTTYAFISAAYPLHTIFLHFNTIYTPGADVTRPQSNHQ